MARPERILSARAVATLTETGRHADGGGLYLMITPGRRRWIWQFQWRGRTREMGLGSAQSFGLKEARDERDRWRAVLLTGRDPIEERKAERLALRPKPTFGEAAEALIRSREKAWKNNKHIAQWRMTMAVYALPLSSLPVDQVGTTEILGVLQPIWVSKPETAARVRMRIEAVLDTARVNGHIGQDVANPARWRGHLSLILPARNKRAKRHFAAMPYAAVPAFMAELQSRPGVAALALEFLILTVGRTSEVTDLPWVEIDRGERIWTVPGSRMKSGRDHAVPLSDAAVSVLEQAAAISDGGSFVFPGQKRGRALSNMSMEAVLRRMSVDNATVHGFRSSFRDWAGDETAFPREVAEAALAHVVGDKAEQAYRRGTAFKKRRALMDAWAAFCIADPGAKVISLTARRP